MVVPGMDPEDHIGAAVDLTTPASIDPTTLSVQGRNAEAIITCLTTAVDGDTVTVNGKVYTIKDVVVHTSYNAPPGVIPIDINPSGTDVELIADRLAKAIMSGDSTVTASVDRQRRSPALQSEVRVKVRQPGDRRQRLHADRDGDRGDRLRGDCSRVAERQAAQASPARPTSPARRCWCSGTTGTPPMVWHGPPPDCWTSRQKLRAMRFRGGKQEEIGPDDGRRDEDKGREDDKDRERVPVVRTTRVVAKASRSPVVDRPGPGRR